MSCAVSLQGVRRAFGAFQLSVSLEVPAAEYQVILGPSGCGKSLLMGMVAGLYPVDDGRVLLDGQDVTGAPPEQRRVGMVFQKFSLFPHCSVRGNVEFGLRVQGLAREERRRRVDELVSRLKLGPLLQRPVETLSGGEAQKVAMARALAIRPRVLLLDEPLSLVDHNTRLELQEELARIHQSLGLTVLHVTHNREEALALGRRCAVMLGGRIVQQGDLQQVLAGPRCPFVARFLGLRPDPWPRDPGCSEVCMEGTGRCDGEGTEIGVQDLGVRA